VVSILIDFRSAFASPRIAIKPIIVSFGRMIMANYKDRIRIHIEGKEYNVVGGDFQDMLAAVKQINGRRFVGELKVWQLPGSAADIQSQLEISGFELEGGAPVIEDTAPAGQPAAPQLRDRIRVRIAGQSMAVTGGSFQEMLAVVKGLPDRRFDGDAKIWEISGDVGVIQGMIQSAGFELEGAGDISQTPVPSMEPPPFAAIGEPPPFESPDFTSHDDPLAFEPPDWLNDDDMVPPPEPPDWWDSESESPPTDLADDEPMWEDEMPSAPSPASSRPKPAGRTGGDQIRIRVGGIPMVVTGGSFQEMLTAIKEIPGRRFDGQDKVWDIPADVGLEKTTQLMNVAGFDVGRV
jgi:hypothetical protein